MFFLSIDIFKHKMKSAYFEKQLPPRQPKHPLTHTHTHTHTRTRTHTRTTDKPSSITQLNYSYYPYNFALFLYPCHIS